MFDEDEGESVYVCVVAEREQEHLTLFKQIFRWVCLISLAILFHPLRRTTAASSSVFTRFHIDFDSSHIHHIHNEVKRGYYKSAQHQFIIIDLMWSWTLLPSPPIAQVHQAGEEGGS